MTQSKKHRHFPRLVLTVAAIGMLAGACGGYTPRLASIVVAPDANILVNGNHQFTAVGRDSLGELFSFTPTWSVVADGGSISGVGLFTAGTVAGRYPYTVRATSDGISGAATVNVITPPVRPAPGLASITITPLESDSLPVATSRQYEAVGRDSSGAIVTIWPTWSVVSGGGTISSGGVFTAGSQSGPFVRTIRASSGNIDGYRSVTVVTSSTALSTMREVVHFAYDRYDLDDATRRALDDKVAVFANNPSMRIIIVGHADHRGTAEYNLDLGTRRAESIRAYLVGAGVSSNRIDMETRGEGEPVASGSSENAMAQNRRGVFVVRD